TILTERIDDIPLLLEPRPRRGLPTLFDTHFPTHGTGTGRSLGWVSPLWLSAIVSRGDHRRGHVEPWVAKRLWTLGVTPGQAVTRVDFTDARRAVVRRRLRHAERWGAFAPARAVIGRGLHEGVAGDARPARRRGCCLRVPTAAGATGPGRVRRRPGSHRERGPPLSAVVREGPQGAREWSAEGAASPV